MEMIIDGQQDPIVFFDVETTKRYEGQILFEFGSIFVCPRRLMNKAIRPWSDPTRSWIPSRIFLIKASPEKSWLLPLTSLKLLTKSTKSYMLKSLAAYFKLGEQVHRSLDDVRVNLEVVKHCGTVLFLESMFSDVLPQSLWISPNEFSTPSTYAIPASFNDEKTKIRVMHHDIDLKLHCILTMRFGIRKSDDASRRLTFVVDASSCLCEVLDECDAHAKQRYKDSGGHVMFDYMEKAGIA